MFCELILVRLWMLWFILLLMIFFIEDIYLCFIVNIVENIVVEILLFNFRV